MYYASSDTRLHIAETTIDRMVDYCMNTPQDTFTFRGSVEQRISLIERNRMVINTPADRLLPVIPVSLQNRISVIRFPE